MRLNEPGVGGGSRFSLPVAASSDVLRRRAGGGGGLKRSAAQNAARRGRERGKPEKNAAPENAVNCVSPQGIGKQAVDSRPCSSHSECTYRKVRVGTLRFTHIQAGYMCTTYAPSGRGGKAAARKGPKSWIQRPPFSSPLMRNDSAPPSPDKRKPT